MQKNIFFDLDSTLVTIEGLDYLAKTKGLEDKVVPITGAAMNGEIPMQVAMEQKMKLLKPSRQDILYIGQVYLKNLTLGARETVHTLQALGYNCWMLTGNFVEAATMVAKHLGIPHKQVLANQLVYDDIGMFHSFDILSPLAGSNGKTLTLQKLGINLQEAVMVGDGNTDLETQAHVGLFIGFGGVVYRSKVAAQAKIYVDIADLRAIIPHITS